MNNIQTNAIPYIPNIGKLPVNQRNTLLIEQGFTGDINVINWKEYNYQPTVKFYLAHDNSNLFVYYLVDEDNVRATYLNDNDAVWEDSCVEAFFSTNIEKEYYNFEFSCIGTALAACGENRQDRKHWDDDKMKKIQRYTSLNKSIVGVDNLHAEWWLQAVIPMDLIGIKKGECFYANFYKCGDSTKQPHFLSWNAINTPQPDFHQPKFFGCFSLD
ncbi:hypothetical protein E9993_14395 [Labilibacter sediminis]|nr:hypothetical protein E9993_14395 [Labilibacter sediminis]